jgi:YVTN family beta-propeller protein
MRARTLPVALVMLTVAALAGLGLPAAATADSPGPRAAGRSAAAHRVTGYVANQLTGTVTAFDTASDNTLATIKVGGFPEQIAITPDGRGPVDIAITP